MLEKDNTAVINPGAPEQVHILFFDIDGTTYQNNIRDLPASAWQTLQQMKDNGMKLVIDTSRAKKEMSQLPQRFITMMDALIMNAGSQIEIDGHTSYRYLDDAHVRKAIALMEANNIVYRWVDDHDGCWLNRSEKDIDQVFYRLYAMIPEVKKWNGERLIQILYYTTDEKLIQEIDEIFSSEIHTHFEIAHEQTPKGIDKGSAMEIVCEHFGCTLANAAAFGDGPNDVCMLKAASLGIAMGNACVECRESADYVTANIENDGLRKACLHFGWIK